MTQGNYYVGLDLNRDRYFPHALTEGAALNLVDNPAQLSITRLGSTSNPPLFSRDLYNPDYTYLWTFSTGTAANATMLIGNSDDFVRGIWVTNGQPITIRLDFLGVQNYVGEQLTFTIGSRGGTTTVSTTVTLTGAWQTASVNLTPDSEHLLISIIRITTLTNVFFYTRNLYIAYGTSVTASYNSGDASDYYEDVSNYVMNMSWNNGMDHYDQAVSGGAKAMVTVDNRDSLFYQNDDTAANILTNSNFTAWDNANNPTSWVGTNISANAQTTQVGIDELHGGSGTGSLNLYATTQLMVSCSQAALTANQRYRVTFSIGASSYIGGVRFFMGVAPTGPYPISRIYTLPGVYTFYFTAGSDSTFLITNNRYPCDITVDFLEVVPVPRYAGLGKESLISIRGTAAGTEYPLFIGRVVKITPDGGQFDVRTMTLECVDAMGEFNNLEYKPASVYQSQTPSSELTLMFDGLDLLWPYAGDYFFLDTSFLGIDAVLSDGVDLTILTGPDDLAIDYATASASNSEKGIAAQAYTRDLMALEIGGRFFIDSRDGKFYMFTHTFDPSITTGATALTDDDFDSFELPYADDVLNTVSVWYKQKRLGVSNIVLWSSNQDIVIPAGGSKSVTGRYFDPTNELINVSALTTEPIVRDTDFIISPVSSFNSKVSVTADAGGQSVTFTITNERQIDVTLTTLQLRGFPLYALTEESITVQNARSVLENNVQKRDYNMPLISSGDTAIAIATGLTSMRGTPIERLQSVTFSATKSDARYLRALSLELTDSFGTPYTLSSSLLKHVGDYIVIGERHSVAAGGENTHMVTWMLSPVELFNYWILEQVGRSELGISTIPMY